jgi:CDP-paratose 2-epimerase
MSGVSANGISEDFPLSGPRSFYGMTKLASEMLLEEYGYAYGTRYIINRCGVIAGPWQMGKVDQGVIAFWVFQHLFRKPLKYIGFGGKGKQVRDFLHVADLAQLVLEQTENFSDFEGQTFNVGGGLDFSFSLNELTKLCQEATGNDIQIDSEFETRAADIRIYVSDCAKLFAKTSWRPAKTASETVADIMQWVRQHADYLERILL